MSVLPLCRGLAPYNYAAAKTTYPKLKQALTTIESFPISTWYTDRTTYKDVAIDTMTACSSGNGHQGQLPTFVVYGLPYKDCSATYSNQGSNKNTATYTTFLRTLVSIVGVGPVVYVLEPDAIGLLTDSPTSCAWTHQYLENMEIAMDVLTATNPHALVYVDVGWWTFKNSSTIETMLPLVDRLAKAGRLKGIAINTSNYRGTAELLTYCRQFVQARPGYTCVFDTSRNYHGPSPTGEWCNAATAGIGAPPTSATGYSMVDYFLWLKTPGQSDGACTQESADALAGPPAGDFFEKGFSMSWDNGYFVDKGLGEKVGEYLVPGEDGYGSMAGVVWAVVGVVLAAALAIIGVGIWRKRRRDRALRRDKIAREGYHTQLMTPSSIQAL